MAIRVMEFLLNSERVVGEILELARLKIADKAEVEPEQVKVRLDIKEGRLCPSFTLPAATRLEQKWAEKTAKEVWGSLRLELVERLMGMQGVRYGTRVWKKKKAEGEETAPADPTASS